MKGDFLSHISVKNEILQRALACLCIIHSLVKECEAVWSILNVTSHICYLRVHWKITQEPDGNWQSLILLCNFNTTIRKREKGGKKPHTILNLTAIYQQHSFPNSWAWVLSLGLQKILVSNPSSNVWSCAIYLKCLCLSFFI